MKIIKLTRNKEAIVSDEDFDRVSQYKWFATDKEGRFYAYHSFQDRSLFGNKNVSMHRFIVGNKMGTMVDHMNNDTLDNRRENLRTCTQAQNNANYVLNTKRNKSGYKGVSFHKPTKKWRATLSFGNKQIWGGLFSDPKEAAKKYNEMALKYFGSFARLNNI